MVTNVSELVIKPGANVYEPWCKGCGICVVLCPEDVLQLQLGKVYVHNNSACTSCRICELHCPEYAITVGGKVRG